MSHLYRCPLCHLPLSNSDGGLSCPSNHQFDKAKEGYFNLLPVQFKKSKAPGDNADMVRARRNFLARGYYDFFKEALVNTLSEAALPASATLLDVGCGEGFYTKDFFNVPNVSDIYGVDVAKTAIKYAAKRYPLCHFSVASSKDAPFDDTSFDALVSIFAPVFEQEFSRLLKPEGFLLAASPGTWHLKAFKSIIYDTVDPFPKAKPLAGFELISEKEVKRLVKLDYDVAKELIMMTPFAWKCKEPHYEILKEMDEINVELEFNLALYKKSE